MYHVLCTNFSLKQNKLPLYKVLCANFSLILTFHLGLTLIEEGSHSICVKPSRYCTKYFKFPLLNFNSGHKKNIDESTLCCTGRYITNFSYPPEFIICLQDYGN
jgi:hypothetical protein